jgi:hypothetical protein
MGLKNLRDRIEEAFPSAGKGFEWGDAEDVTPESFAAFEKRVKDDAGIFVVSTMMRQTPIRGKDLAVWEKHGKPFIKVSKDGRGFVMQERGSYVRVAPYLLKFLPKQKIEESAPHARAMGERNGDHGRDGREGHARVVGPVRGHRGGRAARRAG